MNAVVALAPTDPDAAIPCSQCKQPATVAWPAGTKSVEPYCQACLDKARHKLAVALGSASCF